MSNLLRRRVAWSIFGLSLALCAVDVVNAVTTQSGSTGFWFTPIRVLGFGSVGALIASKHPRNAIGWICLTIALVGAPPTSPYATYALVTRPGALPGGQIAAWLDNLIGIVVFFLIAFLILLFPDGHLPSRRWRTVAWITGVGAAVWMSTFAFAPGSLDYAFTSVTNPFGIAGPAGQLLLGLRGLDWLFLIAVLLVSAASLGQRLVYSRGERRQQLKWLASAAAFLALARLVVSIVPASLTGPFSALIFVAVFTIPLAIGVALFKYRLYDIDVVINRSLVFAALALFITAVYVGIVAGIGAQAVSGGKPNLALSILATAIVAVAFQPVRERIERLANQFVYGRRATPYEVLAQFSQRVASSYASEEILPRMPRMAQVLAQGTAARHADVWLRIGDRLARAASWPSREADATARIEVNDEVPAPVPGAERIVRVRHQGELLGALSIDKRPGETLTRVEDKLLNDLAAQAGLVLRNVRLTAELRARLEEISAQANELRASRQRIVAAQDAKRHRLERNSHDGAQQHLVALTVKLRLAASQARRDSQRAMQTVEALATETGEALDTIRQLARGIYPPALRDKGLVAAIQAQAVRLELPVDLQVTDLKRYDPETEAAIYFTVLEALQNVSKHADARRVRVVLGQRDGAVVFSVSDGGRGFDPVATATGSGLQNMADRVEALGGLTVSATVDGRTSVSGPVPAAAQVLVR